MLFKEGFGDLFDLLIGSEWDIHWLRFVLPSNSGDKFIQCGFINCISVKCSEESWKFTDEFLIG